jgi:predicted HTH transcriptional regulator
MDETKHYELKSQVPCNKELEKYIVGFANAEGGSIYCGVLDDGTAIGILLTRRQRDQLR